MNFTEAKKESELSGHRIARRSWRIGQFGYIVRSTDIPRVNFRNEAGFHLPSPQSKERILIHSHFDMYFPGPNSELGAIIVGWVPLEVDIKANDWYIIEDRHDTTRRSNF